MLLGVIPPSALQAQRYWLQSLYPLPYYSSIDGFWLGGLYARWSPVGFAETPEPFLAVGRFYADFEQTSDEEVVDLLERARAGFPPAVALAH